MVQTLRRHRPDTPDFSYRLYQRVDGKKIKGGKLGDMVPAKSLKVQTRPTDGPPTDTDGTVEWDRVSIGSLLCVRVLLSTVLESDVL